MLKHLLNLIRDDEGTTTVEWIVVGGIAVLVVGAAAKAMADKAATQETSLETGWDTAVTP